MYSSFSSKLCDCKPGETLLLYPVSAVVEQYLSIFFIAFMSLQFSVMKILVCANSYLPHRQNILA